MGKLLEVKRRYNELEEMTSRIDIPNGSMEVLCVTLQYNGAVRIESRTGSNASAGYVVIRSEETLKALIDELQKLL